MLRDLKVNDEFIIPSLRVPEVEIDNVAFPDLGLQNLKVKVIDDFFGNKLCLFEDCLFRSCISKEYNLDWNNTALCKYLNTVFNDSLEKVLNCKVATNLLTSYEVFEERIVSSNFPIAPKHYSLGKDRVAFYNGIPSDYWLSSPCSLSSFCYADYGGFMYNFNMTSDDKHVRPAFLLNFNDVELDFNKYTKKLQVLKSTIEAIYQQNGIENYELDPFSEYFFVTFMNKQFRFEYSDFDTTKNIKKLQDLKKRSIIYLNETINN